MPDSRPNILFVFTDQQRLDTIRALGSHFSARTPNIDCLVKEGFAFTNCHCTSPVCSPSRATLMTGRYPSEVGMPANLYAPSPPLSPALATLGKAFRAGGYETAYHGKWHLGGDIRAFGFEHGVECSHDEATRQMAARFWRDRDWIEHERPFFHVVSFLDPHDLYFFDPEETKPGFTRPWSNTGLPDETYASNTRPKRVAWDEETWGAYHDFYASRIEKVDADIGRLLDDFRCSGFYPNSWIIFASDHGDMAGEHDIPFKGCFAYEGVSRVPLVLVPPRGRFKGDFSRRVPVPDIRPGRSDDLCSLLDLPRTFLDLAGIEPPDSFRGRSLLPWVRGEESGEVHPFVFAQWHDPSLRWARSPSGKYVRHGNGEEEFFDLQGDPAETVNRVADPAFAVRVAEHREALDGHLRDIGEA